MARGKERDRKNKKKSPTIREIEYICKRVERTRDDRAICFMVFNIRLNACSVTTKSDYKQQHTVLFAVQSGFRQFQDSWKRTVGVLVTRAHTLLNGTQFIITLQQSISANVLSDYDRRNYRCHTHNTSYDVIRRNAFSWYTYMGMTTCRTTCKSFDIILREFRIFCCVYMYWNIKSVHFKQLEMVAYNKHYMLTKCTLFLHIFVYFKSYEL